MNTDLMFSSETDQWDTPDDLIKDLSKVFDWDLDVCASRPNVCQKFNSEAEPFKYDWHGLCWMNPPYGREIGHWVNRARNDAYWCKAVVCLLPSRTDTRWWHDSVPFASLVVFIKGRLKFGNASNSAPFPSAFVVFGKLTQPQEEALSKYGIAYKSGAAQFGN